MADSKNEFPPALSVLLAVLSVAVGLLAGYYIWTYLASLGLLGFKLLAIVTLVGAIAVAYLTAMFLAIVFGALGGILSSMFSKHKK
jgi:hypothetical protein